MGSKTAAEGKRWLRSRSPPGGRGRGDPLLVVDVKILSPRDPLTPSFAFSPFLHPSNEGGGDVRARAGPAPPRHAHAQPPLARSLADQWTTRAFTGKASHQTRGERGGRNGHYSTKVMLSSATIEKRATVYFLFPFGSDMRS